MRIISKSPNQTQKLAENIARQLKGGEIIQLNGRMGAGKTVFAKGIATGLGITSDVVSPTFAILNIYDSTPRLCHYDCYRLGDCAEASDSGLDEYFAQKDCVCLIEWAENIEPLLRHYATKSVNITYQSDNVRQIELIGFDNFSIIDQI